MTHENYGHVSINWDSVMPLCAVSVHTEGIPYHSVFGTVNCHKWMNAACQNSHCKDNGSGVTSDVTLRAAENMWWGMAMSRCLQQTPKKCCRNRGHYSCRQTSQHSQQHNSNVSVLRTQPCTAWDITQCMASKSCKCLVSRAIIPELLLHYYQSERNAFLW